jgi:hypothetical protein
MGLLLHRYLLNPMPFNPKVRGLCIPLLSDTSFQPGSNGTMVGIISPWA